MRHTNTSIRGTKHKALAVELIGCAAFFVVFAALAYLGLVERSLSFGAPRAGGGVVHLDGARAVQAGFVFLAASFGAIAYGARYTKYKRIYWAFLSVVWIGVAISYLI